MRSADINAYIKEVTGSDFTAKDFRTWNTTVLAAVGLGVSAAATSTAGKKRAIARAVKEVSEYLGNTPAVCRSSYIDPRVIDRYGSGETVAPTLEKLGNDAPPNRWGGLATQGIIEDALLHLLDASAPGQVAA